MMKKCVRAIQGIVLTDGPAGGAAEKQNGARWERHAKCKVLSTYVSTSDCCGVLLSRLIWQGSCILMHLKCR